MDIKVANLLPVSALLTPKIWEGPELPAYQISTRYLNQRPRYYYFRFLETNDRHVEILLLASTLTFSLLLACDFALVYQIFWKLDDGRRCYDVISILQDGGHSVVSLLLVSDLVTLRFQKVYSYRHTEFRPNISIHSRYTTTSGYWKQTAAILKFYFRFRFSLFHSHRHVVFVGITNFIGVGLSAAELWRHSDFQDSGRLPCWIWFGVMVAHLLCATGGLCFILKFRFYRIYSFGDNAIFIFWHFGLKLPIHAHYSGVLGHMASIVLTRQKARPCAETRRLSHKAWKSIQRFDLGAGSRKKDKAGQDSQKSPKGIIFHLIGEKSPLNRFAPKFAQ